MKMIAKIRGNGRGIARANGRRRNPEGARKAIEAAQRYIQKHGSPLSSLTDEQIIARVKKTREELVKERFGNLFR